MVVPTRTNFGRGNSKLAGSQLVVFAFRHRWWHNGQRVMALVLTAIVAVRFHWHLCLRPLIRAAFVQVIAATGHRRFPTAHRAERDKQSGKNRPFRWFQVGKTLCHSGNFHKSRVRVLLREYFPHRWMLVISSIVGLGTVPILQHCFDAFWVVPIVRFKVLIGFQISNCGRL